MGTTEVHISFPLEVRVLKVNSSESISSFLVWGRVSSNATDLREGGERGVPGPARPK